MIPQLQKRIVNDPAWMIRDAARRTMKGRRGLLFFSSMLYLICASLPILFVEQIAGLMDVMEKMYSDYLALLESSPATALQELSLAYSDKISVSPASFLFILLIPGPLTLGLSSIWLHVIRGREAYADMVFSGFSNFFRVIVMDALRRIIMILFAFLFVIPGIMAYYRYNLTFFLLADNPSMKPHEALSLGRYYMRFNKMNRFFLDLSFTGWFVLSAVVLIFASNAVTLVMMEAGAEPSVFIQYLIVTVLASVIFAPVYAYRGMAAAEYYHRAICRDPRAESALVN